MGKRETDVDGGRTGESLPDSTYPRDYLSNAMHSLGFKIHTGRKFALVVSLAISFVFLFSLVVVLDLSGITVGLVPGLPN